METSAQAFILTLQTTLTRLQTRQRQTVETNNTSQARLKELRRVRLSLLNL